jgi:hypothetical protein
MQATGGWRFKIRRLDVAAEVPVKNGLCVASSVAIFWPESSRCELPSPPQCADIVFQVLD